MNKEQIIEFLHERRRHYSERMSQCSLNPERSDLLNSATGSWFAISEALRKIEPKDEMRSRIIKDLIEKCVAENGSLFGDGAKGFWDQIKELNR